MSSNNDYIGTAIAWMNEFLPSNVSLDKENKSIINRIPIGVASPYFFHFGVIMDTRVLFVLLVESDDMSPSTIKQHGVIIKEKTGLLPVFIIHKMEAYRTKRLIKAGLNIVIENKVIFLPDFLFVVRNQTKVEDADRSKIDIPATAQLMILYHIQKGCLDGYNSKQLQELFPLSYATINRAIQWLRNADIIKLEGNKEKILTFNYRKKELWEYTKKYLRNPIETIDYTPDFSFEKNEVMSGENALAEYSMLSGGPLTVAVSKKRYQELKKSGVYWDKYGEACIQIWMYDPKLLSINGIADKLSLYLTLKEHYDERVQIELENMLNEMQW